MIKQKKSHLKLPLLFGLALTLTLVPLLSSCSGDGSASSKKASSKASSSHESNITESEAVLESEPESNESGSAPNVSSSKSQGKTSSKSNAVSSNSSSKKNVFAADPYSEIPSSLKGTTVKVLMWTEVWAAEKAAAAAFTAKTNIKVEFIVTTLEQYQTKLASLIAAKDSPDIFVMSKDYYVAMTTKFAQPLDSKIFRLDDPVWGKEDMNAMQLKPNKYYSVNIPGSWMSSDGMYCLYYNKSLFEREGMTTPEQLQKEGKWNWDTLYDTCKELKDYGYEPLSLGYDRLLMLAGGTDYVDFKNGKFVNNIGNTLLEAVWKYTAKLTKEGLSFANSNFTGFQNGKTAMLAHISYGMRKDSGYGFNKMKDEVAAVQMPAPKGAAQTVPHDTKTWGVAIGAKNVEGAAFFLRYWLDPVNYDMTSSFLNSNMQKTFNTLIGMKKTVFRSSSVLSMGAGSTVGALSYELAHTDEAQVNALLQQRKNVVQLGVDKSNSALAALK